MIALALSTGLACSDPGAGTLPSASPTPTVTLSPTPSATPNYGHELRQAVHAYFDALYAAGVDPASKTDALAALIDESCGCRRVIDTLREMAREGRYVDYRYGLRDIKVVEVGRLGGDIRYTVERSAGAERDSSGQVVQRFAATTERYGAHFRHAHGRWYLDRLTRFA